MTYGNQYFTSGGNTVFSMTGTEYQAAAITAQISGGAVTGGTITAHGRYDVIPRLLITGCQGAGATALLSSLTSSGVVGIRLNNGGFNYAQAPKVAILARPGDTGVGATASATSNGSAVTSVRVTNAGHGYKIPPSVVFEQGVATGHLLMSGTSAGPLPSCLTFTTSAQTVVAALAVKQVVIDSSTAVDQAALGFVSVTPIMSLSVAGAPVFSEASAQGSGATATASVLSGAITGITVTNGGSGYSVAAPPQVKISDSTGSGAIAVAVVNTSGQVAYVIVPQDCGGNGYSESPTVTIGKCPWCACKPCPTVFNPTCGSGYGGVLYLDMQYTSSGLTYTCVGNAGTLYYNGLCGTCGPGQTTVQGRYWSGSTLWTVKNSSGVVVETITRTVTLACLVSSSNYYDQPRITGYANFFSGFTGSGIYATFNNPGPSPSVPYGVYGSGKIYLQPLSSHNLFSPNGYPAVGQTVYFGNVYCGSYAGSIGNNPWQNYSAVVTASGEEAIAGSGVPFYVPYIEIASAQVPPTSTCEYYNEIYTTNFFWPQQMWQFCIAPDVDGWFYTGYLNVTSQADFLLLQGAYGGTHGSGSPTLYGPPDPFVGANPLVLDTVHGGMDYLGPRGELFPGSDSYADVTWIKCRITYSGATTAGGN